MHRLRVAIVLGALAAAAGVAAIVMRRRAEAPVPAEGVDAGSATVAPTAAPPALAAAPARPANLGPTTCSITGTVRRAGSPVAAAVEVRRAEGVARDGTSAAESLRKFDASAPREAPVLGRTRSGADGRFAFPSLPTGAYAVRASADDGARGVASVTLRFPAERGSTAVELLSATVVLSGAVAYDDASPYVGVVHVVPVPAALRVWYDDDATGSDFDPAPVDVKSLPTDEHGAFTATGLAPGAYEVVVVDGAVRARVLAWVPSPESSRLVLPRRADALEGVVVDRATGDPIADARVVWTGLSTGLRKAVRTDASGRFAVPGLVNAWLQIGAAGYSSYARRIDAKHPFEPRVALDRAGAVEGRATFAADGRPAAGIAVEAANSGAFWGTTRPAGRAVTDADGRYEIGGLEPGEVSVRVHDARGVARGMADLAREDSSEPLPYDPLSTRVEAGGTAHLDLVIEPAARIVGRLTDAAGLPVAGVAIDATRPGMAYPSSQMPPSYWGVGHAVTDADGRYVADGLVPGWFYRIDASRGSERAQGGATAPSGGAEVTVDLAFPATQSLDLRTVDASTGAGVAGLSLVVRPEEHWGPWWTGLTGEGGLARVGPLPRESLWIELAGDAPWSVEKASQTIPAPPADGVPTPWTVRVSRNPPGADGDAGSAAWASALISALGANGVRTGKGAGNPLVVKVVDADGRPVPRADLAWRLLVDGSGNMGTVPVIDGQATVPRDSDPRVSAWLEVSRARGTDGARLFLGTARLGPIDDATRTADVRLPVAKPVEGRVLDDEGRGVVGLRVRLATPGDDDFASARERGGADRTDGEGRFRLVSLGNEAQVLVLNVPDRFACVAPVAVVPGSAPLEVRLRRSVAVTVTVTDASGKPTVGLEVSAWDLRSGTRGISNVLWTSRSSYGTTDASGVATLEGLDPEATYSLHVKTSRAGEPEKEWRRDRWSPANTSVRLTGARDIRGIVRDPEGKPLAGATVIGFVANRWVTSTESGADGTFVLHDDGTEGLRLQATMARWRGVCSATVAAPAGDEPLTITLDPGLELSFRLVGDRVSGRTVVLYVDAPGVGEDDAEDQQRETDEAGLVRFRALRRDVSYVAWVAPSTAGRWLVPADVGESTAFVAGLKAGLPAPVVELRLQPGGTLVARPPAGAAWVHPRIFATHGPLRIDGKARPDGAFEFRGLCDVEWNVVIHSLGGGRRYEGQGRPGAEIPLAPATAETPR